MAGIPHMGHLVELQQMGCQGPGTAIVIELHRQLLASGNHAGGPAKGQAGRFGHPGFVGFTRFVGFARSFRAFRRRQKVADALPQLIAPRGRTVPAELEKIPALAAAPPDHRTVVLVHPASIAIRRRLGMGHHPLHGDVGLGPAPVAGHLGRLTAHRFQLHLRGRDRPGIGPAAHTGAGEGHRIAVAPPGVGRQVAVVGMQALEPAITTDDRVVEPRAHPAVGRGGPVQIDRGRHGGSAAGQGGNQLNCQQLLGPPPPAAGAAPGANGLVPAPAPGGCWSNPAASSSAGAPAAGIRP